MRNLQCTNEMYVHIFVKTENLIQDKIKMVLLTMFYIYRNGLGMYLA
jgi:hypothetical protein